MKEIVRKRYHFYGRVQGVGFRYHAQYAASMFDATGWVHNCYDDSVEMELQCTADAHDRILQMLKQARFVRIERLDCHEIPLASEIGFHIR